MANCSAKPGSAGAPLLSTLVALAALALAGPATAAEARFTARDMEQFGRNLITIIEQRQADAFAALLDVQTMAARAADLIADGEEAREHYLRQFADVEGARAITRDFFEEVSPDDHATFVRVVERGEALRPLLRVEMGEKYTYIEFMLRRSSAGQALIVDWKSLSRGLMYSEIRALLAEPRIPHRLMAHLVGVESIDDATMARLNRIDLLRANRQYAAAYSQFDGLPAQVADSHFILGQHLHLAEVLKDEQGIAAIQARIKALHAGDAHTALGLFPYTLDEGDLATSLRLIDTIERHVGSDGFTSLLREHAYGLAGRHLEAVASAQQAIQREPTYVEAYFRLGLALLPLRRYEEAIELFELLRTRLGMAFTREYFAGLEDYGEFMASPQFEAWLPAAPRDP